MNDMFMNGLMDGFTIARHKRYRSRLKRIKELKKQIESESGQEIDKVNLNNDFNRVYKDIHKAIAELKPV